jgi:putative ubiquitin-RnfH superfamily antitoxin RatB of RatAB toxin-antitoxin module
MTHVAIEVTLKLNKEEYVALVSLLGGISVNEIKKCSGRDDTATTIAQIYHSLDCLNEPDRW